MPFVAVVLLAMMRHYHALACKTTREPNMLVKPFYTLLLACCQLKLSGALLEDDPKGLVKSSEIGAMGRETAREA